MSSGAAGFSHSRLFYIKDNISNYRFSILPASPVECQQQHSDFSLVAVNEETIPTYGKRSLTLNCGEPSGGYLLSLMYIFPL